MAFPRYPAGDSRNVRDYYAVEFKGIFGVDLARFWDVRGFDVVEFEEVFYPDSEKGAESLRDFVEERFGSVGVALIDSILRDGICGEVDDE